MTDVNAIRVFSPQAGAKTIAELTLLRGQRHLAPVPRPY
jgi:hypothetical protein